MKWISRYRSEKPWYCVVFNPTETHTFQPGLKKVRKASQFSKRSFERITILTKSTFRGVLFVLSYLNWCNWHSCCDFSRLQMWLQSDKVSCFFVFNSDPSGQIINKSSRRVIGEIGCLRLLCYTSFNDNLLFLKQQ